MSRDQRRDILLKVGEELVLDLLQQGQLNPMGSITSKQIEEQANQTRDEDGELVQLSRGPIYYLWANGLEEYRTALALRLCEKSVDIKRLEKQASQLLTKTTDWRQIVRQLSAWEFNRIGPSGEDHRAEALYVFLSAVAGPDLRQRLKNENDDMLQMLAGLYGMLLAELGRRVIVGEGQTERGQLLLMTSILAAMTVGFTHEAQFDLTLGLESSLPGYGDGWLPFSIAIIAVVELMTEPDN